MSTIEEIIRHWGLESVKSTYNAGRLGKAVSSMYFRHPERNEWFRISDHLLPDSKIDIRAAAWHRLFGTADIGINPYYSRSLAYYEKALTDLCELPDLRRRFAVERNRFSPSARKFTVSDLATGCQNYLVVMPNGNVDLIHNAGLGSWNTSRFSNFRGVLKHFAS